MACGIFLIIHDKVIFACHLERFEHCVALGNKLTAFAHAQIVDVKHKHLCHRGILVSVNINMLIIVAHRAEIVVVGVVETNEARVFALSVFHQQHIAIATALIHIHKALIFAHISHVEHQRFLKTTEHEFVLRLWSAEFVVIHLLILVFARKFALWRIVGTVIEAVALP